MAALRHYYQATFEFQQIGLMYDLASKLRKSGRGSFDVINLSGVLYHVFSPLMVLAGVRALLKRNGLMIVSTNVVIDDAFTMQFDGATRLVQRLRVLVDQLLDVALQPDQHLLPDRDVEVDLDRLVGRLDRNAARQRRAEQRGGEQSGA